MKNDYQLSKKSAASVLVCCDDIAMHYLTSFPTISQVFEGVADYEWINGCLLTTEEKQAIYQSFELEYTNA